MTHRPMYHAKKESMLLGINIYLVHQYHGLNLTRSAIVRVFSIKGALYIIWCSVNRLGDSGVKVV